MRNYSFCSYKKSIFFDYYYYVDVRDDYSSKIFLDNKIFVYKIKKLECRDTDYVIIQCKTSKRNRYKFVKCMKDLTNKMLIVGNKDYEKFAEQAMANLSTKNNYIIDCSGLSDNVYCVTVNADDMNHKEFMYIPYDLNSVVKDDRKVADIIKNLIDRNNLPYRKLTITVKNINIGKVSMFSFINEDENSK